MPWDGEVEPEPLSGEKEAGLLHRLAWPMGTDPGVGSSYQHGWGLAV